MPSRPMMARNPMAPTNGGRINGTSTNAPNSPLSGKRCRALSKANGNAISMLSSVVPAAIPNALPSPSNVAGSRKTRTTCFSVQSALNNPASAAGSCAKPPRIVNAIG
ncbi:MAG: hypothetical protein KatS3mg103_0852 [Phycisphaerales bacterium]|nr:MAG: hypothetical protein KatS3mg103_0852 [Phycisphaerales bacterium]